MSITEAWQWLVFRQDYLWFLVALGWTAAGLAWWRLGRGERGLAWLPLAVVAAGLTAGVEVSKLVIPVKPVPGVPPWLAWDIALAAGQALLVSGLAWLAIRGQRGAGWKGAVFGAGAAVAVVARYWFPAAGAEGMSVLVLLAAMGLIRTAQTRDTARLALLALAGTVLFATNGPLAETLDQSFRYREVSVFGPVAAAVWLGGLGAAARVLYLRAEPAGVAAAGLRPLFRAQMVWLMAGLGLAQIMGYWARRNFEASLLARTRMAAELIDRDELAAHLGPAFRVERVGAHYFISAELNYYHSDYLRHTPMPKLWGRLTAIEDANPDAIWAHVVTMRDGWLVHFAFSDRMPAVDPGELGHYGRPDAVTWRAWAERRAEVLVPFATYYGPVVQARAPLVSRDGRMLGWLGLDLYLASWLAAQVQARLLAFAVVVLGCAWLTANWQQRERERRRADARREAEAAQAASQLKTMFLAKVSHELRTPIQSLLGYSELLRASVATDAKAAGWLAALQQHGTMMTRLVNDLIDLAAVEAGSFQLVPKVVEPAAIVTQAVESFRPAAEARGLGLACFMDPAVPDWVLLDGERFRQVLVNLVANAVKFTETGGVTVVLRAGPGDRLVLTVRDTGPGISPADQERLFQAFTRLEPTATKEGSGLGLALARALCRSMGGELTVESDGATGTAFTATLTATAAGRPAEENADAATEHALRGFRMLVVDDNPLVRELFVAFLTEQGASCAAAGSGAEALAQAEAGPCDVVVLDLALPDGDGTSLVAPLRGLRPGLRVVGVSAHAGTADRERALAAGMDAFLIKPVALGALAAAVIGESGAKPPDRFTFRTAEALRERLTRQFRRELPAQRQELAQALSASDWPRVGVLAHQLKNSAVVVRDDALFDASTGLEQAATAHDAPAAARWWKRCDPSFERWAPSAEANFPAAFRAEGNVNP
jgi:signal transduction histidine kinase/DNA-binding response OmpR family regulator